jgi:heme-degrading monooxygenase HmoA
MPGYLGHELHACIEAENRYLLLVRWESVEAHTRGFRGSPEYERLESAAAPFLRPVSHRRALSPALRRLVVNRRGRVLVLF